MIERFFLKVERVFAGIFGFASFMIKNLLISSAFLGLVLIAAPKQFQAGLDMIRPIQTDAFQKSTMRLLGMNNRGSMQVKADSGTDLAEIGFATNGQALQKEDFSELNMMNERRVSSLEEEVAFLRGEIKKLRIKYQFGGTDPIEEKQDWSWKTMMGISPNADGVTK